MTSIADGAFAFCAGLSAISVNAGNAAYRSLSGVLFDQGQTTLVAYPAGNAATSYAIPAGVTSIGGQRQRGVAREDGKIAGLAVEHDGAAAPSLLSSPCCAR